MPPLILEGETLGSKHKYYNNYLKQIINGKEAAQLTDINYEDEDVDNLIKIDVASHNKNVEYIINILKCQDMLYVSRALKNSSWIITDPQYENIINPDYLKKHLFPEMTSKAINKLMLQIRLKLQDEQRVEQFFMWLKDEDIKNALKWLPKCSIPFIEKMVQEYAECIEKTLFKRLFEKSLSILKVYLRSFDKHEKFKKPIESSKCFIRSHPDEFFQIFDTAVKVIHPIYRRQTGPKFGKRTTGFLMKTCPNRFTENFEKYCDNIHMSTFAKHMRSKNVKEFLLKEAEKAKALTWLQFDKIKIIIECIPYKERFNFVKEVFIDKIHIEEDTTCRPLDPYICAINKLNTVVTNNHMSKCTDTYIWYEFAPFDIAFEELVKMISLESSQEKKIKMLELLLKISCKNTENIKTLLKYYREKHINDNLTLKKQFVNNLLSYHLIPKYDQESWEYLKGIFQSIGVYTKSEEGLENCFNAIIIYEVTHGQKIPNTIGLDYKFDYLKQYIKKMTQQQRELIFIYLYRAILSKIENHNIESKLDFAQAIDLVNTTFKLLVTCGKTLINHDSLIDKLRELLKIKRENKWDNDLSSLYNFNKSWRKLIFEESLSLCPSENVCLNILKHGPHLLIKYEPEIGSISCNDKIPLKKFLNKLRIYWPQSLGNDWVMSYRRRIEQSSGQSTSITGKLFVLLKRHQVAEMVKYNAPTEAKVKWENIDEIKVGLQRQIAKTMHVARPQPEPELVVLYAKGDYLQYALPSLSAIFYNLNLNRSLVCIPKLLDSPVSLQKHAIRFAFTKMSTEALKDVFTEFWISSKNLSIRAVIFKLTHAYLCKETNEDKLKNVWLLLDFLMNNLTTKEDKSIYDTLSKIDKIPITNRGIFVEKSYKILKKLNQTEDKSYSNYDSSIKKLTRHTQKIMSSMDPDFIVDLILEFIDSLFTTEKLESWTMDIIIEYLYEGRHTEAQKIDKILTPLMQRSLEHWSTKPFVKKSCDALIEALQYGFYKQIEHKNLPIKIYSYMLSELEKLPIEENYILIRKWKLTVEMAILSEKHLSTTFKDDKEVKREAIEAKLAPEYGEICDKILREDVEQHFSCIYILFSKAFNGLYRRFSEEVQAIICQSFLSDEKFIEGYLCGIKLVPVYCYCERRRKSKKVHDTILAHPTLEVRMHYYNKYNNNQWNSAVMENCKNDPSKKKNDDEEYEQCR